MKRSKNLRYSKKLSDHELLGVCPEAGRGSTVEKIPESVNHIRL